MLFENPENVIVVTYMYSSNNFITVLFVFSGSGYLTACMAEMVGNSGKVIGIDHIPELVEKSRQNIKRGNADLLESGRVLLVTGDGRQGYADGTCR